MIGLLTKGVNTMYKGYSELEKLPAEAYLEWENFDTLFDELPVNLEKAQDAYQKGLDVGKEYDEITLSVRGVWGAHKENSHCQSYEGIGYHANTKWLLKGFLDSGCPIAVYRFGESEKIYIK
jgi:hypothetical protein